MSQVRSFAPWIAYPVASALFGWHAGAAVALGFCVVGLLRDGRAAASDTFRLAALGFFAALSAVAWIDPTSALHRFVPALIPATLAVAAAASILVARPFTLAFAKRVAPREFWDTPLFVHINVVLTAVWATSFAITAAIIAVTLTIAPHAVGILLAAQVAGFVVPMRITRWYPAQARARYAMA
jgi:hypothetical protein